MSEQNHSCEKCVFNPCDRTSKCNEGTYFIRDVSGNLIKMVEIPISLKPVITRAIAKALFEGLKHE